MDKRVGVIIVAGGSGRRMGGQLPKQFAEVGGTPILVRTVARFMEALPTAQIVVVLPEEQVATWSDIALRHGIRPHTIAVGGAERFHSVSNGLKALRSDTEIIAVHDGVRPFASVDMIRKTVDCAILYGSAIPAVDIVDSIRYIAEGKSEIVDRNTLRSVQTPQVFRAEWLLEAYRAEYSTKFTDDASVVEATGYAITLCEGERTNIKLTTPDDMLFAEAIATHEQNTKERNGI